MGWVIFIIIVIGVICLCISWDNTTTKNKEVRRQELKRKEKEECDRKNYAWRKQVDAMISEYGQPSKEIVIKPMSGWFEQHCTIIVFEEKSVIWIKDKVYKFSELLDCEMSDSQTTTNSQGHSSVTKTSTGSMLGRAVVGGILTGGVGAVIGAATAKKETITTPTETQIKVTHDYSIVINIDSISEPLKSLHIGRNEAKAREVVALLNVIITRNANESK